MQQEEALRRELLAEVESIAPVAAEQAAGGTFSAGSDSDLGPSPTVPTSITTKAAP